MYLYTCSPCVYIYKQCHKITDYAVDKLKFKHDLSLSTNSGVDFFVSCEIIFENTNFNIISCVTKIEIMCLS